VSAPLIDRNKEICVRYLEGESGADLARQFGISRERVRQILKRNEIPTRPRSMGETREIKAFDVTVQLTLRKRVTVAAYDRKQAKEEARFQMGLFAAGLTVADGVPYTLEIRSVRAEES
jgi:hypothetical protein